MTGTIDQIDTTGLFAQYNAAFNAWFAELHNELDSNQAANLLNMIQDNTARIDAVETKAPDGKQWRWGIDENRKIYLESGD